MGEHKLVEKLVTAVETVLGQLIVDARFKEELEILGQVARSWREGKSKVDEPELLLGILIGDGEVDLELSFDLERYPPRLDGVVLEVVRDLVEVVEVQPYRQQSVQVIEPLELLLRS